MITLQPITEQNFINALQLSVLQEQKPYLASPAGILARGYVYRRERGRVWAICEDNEMVGLAMLHDMRQEPACYHLCQLMIDGTRQGRGHGQAALKLILDHCRREGRFSRVEVCVKRDNAAGIHVYERAGFLDTGYRDPDAPDCVCLAYGLPPMSDVPLEIRLTGKEDLCNVQRLWATPAVMEFVGFPEGLWQTMEHLEKEWLPWVQQPPKRQHWSVYSGGAYCGETFYSLDRTGLAAMDIKLLPEARGKGIAYTALTHGLNAAFREGGASRAYVDPAPENQKALALYAALGFLPASRPDHLEPLDCPYTYLEMTRENWEARHADCI